MFSLCKNRDLAEDITQETFVKALLSLPENAVNPVAWLYKVANHLTVDEFRRSKRFTELPEEEPDSGTAYDDTADRFIRDERCRRLYKALGTLEETDRKLIVLYYFSGLSQREIAGVTSLSFANVRVRMLRVREKLKNILSEDESYDI